MKTAALDRCPTCSRELSGRPAPNACPDCGFEYDEHTRVWLSSESWARLALVYTALGLVCGLVVAGSHRLSLGYAPDPTLPLLVAIVAPALGLFLRRLIGGRISGRFVALTPAGILVGTRPRPRLITWHEFDRVTEQRGIAKIQLRESGLLIPIDDIFANTAEYMVFREELKQAARRHQRSNVS